MFQPSPKPLLPTILKAKLPIWLLVGVLAAQFVISSTDKQIEPNCKIKVQRVHQSTYSFEFQKLSEAKLKISTLCDVPQAYTSLTVNFEEVLPNRRNSVVKQVSKVIARPSLTRPNYVLIENLTLPCNGKGVANYFGRASGQVHLKDSLTVAVSGNSDIPNLLKCRISAK
jgi:hypothetical protein